MYELSTSFVAHSADIVGIAVNADDSIVSCSKDKTTKIWKYNENTQKFFEAEIFHSKSNLGCKFPMCVCILLPSDLFECGLIVTGDNDNRIFVYEPRDPVPIRHSRAHSNAVSRIARSHEQNTFLSASWDTTVKMWLVTEDSLKCLLTIQSHSASVWAVLQMERKLILTGSADKLICVLDVHGKLVNTLTGHKGCVRDLVEINDEQILSCSNDCTVRRWSVDSGKCLQILTGHPNFVYSVRVIDEVIVSSGEDKCLLLWSQGKPVQTITLPARSIWTVSVMSNNDIVVGSSDGVIRIFTASKNRRADKKTLLNFTEECSSRDPIKLTMGRRKFSRLPGANVLSSPGVREGQKVFVRLNRESEEVNCFSWSLTEKKWKDYGLVEVDFTPLVSSNFRPVEKNPTDGENNQLNLEQPMKPLRCAICRRKFYRKSSLRKHVLEREHIIDKRTPKFLLSVLPRTHPYQITSLKKNESAFRLKLCLENMNSRSDLQAWVKSFAELSNCVYWKFSHRKYGYEGCSYSEFYRCQHYSSKINGKETLGKGNCQSTINAVLKYDSVDDLYYGKININFCHNHPVHDVNKCKEPTSEVRDMFRQMCHDGFPPFKALRVYRKQLKMQSPETFPDLLQDRSVCPDYVWIRNFFHQIKAEQKTLEQSEIVNETQDLRRSPRIRDMQPDIEDIDEVYEIEECEEMETEEIVSADSVEHVAESNVNIILEVVHEFGIFLGKLGEDPTYYREGIQSMSRELKKLCESTAESRLTALYSFNKSCDNMKR